MRIQWDLTAFRQTFAYVCYGAMGLGLVMQGIEVLFPDFALEWADLFVLSKTLGVLFALLFTLILLQVVNYFGFDRIPTVGLWFGIIIAILFIAADRYLTVLRPVEEFGINVRFRLSAGQITETELQGTDAIHTQANPKAHPAITIVGIDTPTVDAFGGFPFPWYRYGQLINALEGSELNTLMFDVFFVDAQKNFIGPKETLSDAMKRNGKVIVDYSFEMARIDRETLNSADLQARIRELNRFRIPPQNIEETEHNQREEWVTYPAPPLPEVGQAVKGLGSASIRYDLSGVNRKMPMIFKWNNNIYPSIGLLLACRYYGIDVTKDVVVKLGEYIKLKNIPEKKVSFSFEQEPVDIMVKPNPERTITIPVDEEGFMYVNFVGGAFSFNSISMKEIVLTDLETPGAYGRDNPQFFKDKVLLTAMYYATGVSKDIHPSPFGDTAGIEHHANALNTILNQNFMTYAPEWLDYTIFMITGLFIGFVVPRFKILMTLLASVVFAILFLVEVFWVFNSYNYVHTFLSPYLQMAITLIGIVGYKSLAEEENVKYIRSTFSKFVSKDVVNQLLENPELLKLGGEKKEVTVFFSDIRGFTNISEALQPEELVALLNEYLSEMTEIVLRYRGTVDKYMGDAIMAFWGAPVRNDHHALHGCLCALMQMRELKKLQERWREQKYPPMDVGIGLNTGDAVVGNMGSAHRMDYTVMGDTINLGSRLEGTNKVYSTNIIISESTYQKVKDQVVARELDMIKVKGKTEPVRIYELIDVVDEKLFEEHQVRAL